jgi:hypothetical protein
MAVASGDEFLQSSCLIGDRADQPSTTVRAGLANPQQAIGGG